MKVKVPLRPLRNMGSMSCKCCDHLSWKELKFDKQQFKEAVNDADYAMTRKKAA